MNLETKNNPEQIMSVKPVELQTKAKTEVLAPGYEVLQVGLDSGQEDGTSAGGDVTFFIHRTKTTFQWIATRPPESREWDVRFVGKPPLSDKPLELFTSYLGNLLGRWVVTLKDPSATIIDGPKSPPLAEVVRQLRFGDVERPIVASRSSPAKVSPKVELIRPVEPVRPAAAVIIQFKPTGNGTAPAGSSINAKHWPTVHPVARIRTFKGQPRELFDKAELDALAGSLGSEDGNLNPIVVRPVTDSPDYDFELIDGERRWQAAQLAKIAKINIWVDENAKEPRDQFRKAFILNFCKAGHTVMETSNGLQRLRGYNYTIDQMAVGVGRNVQWVEQFLAYQNLHPDLRKLLDPPTPEKHRLGLGLASLLARIPDKEEQMKRWKEVENVGPRQARAALLGVLKDQGEMRNRTIGVREARRKLQRFLGTLNDSLTTLIPVVNIRVLEEMFARMEKSEIERTISLLESDHQKVGELLKTLQRSRPAAQPIGG